MSRKHSRYLLRWTIVVLAVVGVFVGAVYGWRRYNYPYGVSRCSLKQIGLALHLYAEQHDGRFPSGGGCPEASLSLLYQSNCNLGSRNLCGKTKSPEAAQEILERGELLGPDTCDWHYVEGLTLSDDPRLALVWDKVGLGHNGQRLPNGGHWVCRLDCSEELIPASKWQQFLDEQAHLMANRTEAAKQGRPMLTAKVRLPSGEIVDHYDAAYYLDESHETATGSGGTKNCSGRTLDASVLRWHRLQDDNTYTFNLWLGNWKSRPVEVRVSQGIAVPDAVIFEMEDDPDNPPPNSTVNDPVPRGQVGQ